MFKYDEFDAQVQAALARNDDAQNYQVGYCCCRRLLVVNSLRYRPESLSTLQDVLALLDDLAPEKRPSEYPDLQRRLDQAVNKEQAGSSLNNSASPAPELLAVEHLLRAKQKDVANNVAAILGLMLDQLQDIVLEIYEQQTYEKSDELVSLHPLVVNEFRILQQQFETNSV